MNRRILHGILLLFAFYQTGCSYTTGEGEIVEKGFAVDKFKGVEMDGSFDIKIEQATTQNVIVSGHENIIDKLRLNVMDEVLYVSLEEGNYLNYELEVRSRIPDLNVVSLDGSGDIKVGTFVDQDILKLSLDGSGDIETIDDSVLDYDDVEIELEGSGDVDLKLKANKVTVEMDGSGDVELEGIAESFEVELSGSGDVKAYQLEVLHASARLDGSGGIELYATKNLDAALNGSGNIKYKGEPQVEASIDGSGSIKSK